MINEYNDIVKPRKQILTFPEYREIISEFDKVWREILKEKEKENELLKEQLRVEQEFVRTELKKLKKDYDRLYLAIENLPDE